MKSPAAATARPAVAREGPIPAPEVVRAASVRARMAFDAARDGDLGPADGVLSCALFLREMLANEPAIGARIRARARRVTGTESGANS